MKDKFTLPDVYDQIEHTKKVLRQITSVAKFYRFDEEESNKWWEHAYSLYDELQQLKYIKSLYR